MKGSYRFILGRPSSASRAIKWLAAAAIIAAALGWSAAHLELSGRELIKGAPWIWDLVSRMLPPNWTFFPRLVKPACDAIFIALWGTLLAVVLALPVTFLAARNLSPSPVVFHATRQVLNIARGIHEIIFALIFVAAVGLGPFADAVEEVDSGPVEALRATGASALQTVVFAVVPQALPAWIAATLYRFEANLRASTVLGMVGAGGIGFELFSSMKLFQYHDTAACVFVILALVMSADYLSSRLRARVLEE
jgi:phosphonate transport system permease protein